MTNHLFGVNTKLFEDHCWQIQNLKCFVYVSGHRAILATSAALWPYSANKTLYEVNPGRKSILWQSGLKRRTLISLWSAWCGLLEENVCGVKEDPVIWQSSYASNHSRVSSKPKNRERSSHIKSPLTCKYFLIGNVQEIKTVVCIATTYLGMFVTELHLWRLREWIKCHTNVCQYNPSTGICLTTLSS